MRFGNWSKLFTHEVVFILNRTFSSWNRARELALLKKYVALEGREDYISTMPVSAGYTAPFQRVPKNEVWLIVKSD